MNNDITSQVTGQNIVLKDRKRLEISGIKKIESFFVAADSLSVQIFAVVNHPVMRDVNRLPVLCIKECIDGRFQWFSVEKPVVVKKLFHKGYPPKKSF